MANLNIKLVKSLNGRLEKQVATAHSMGLRKIDQVGDLLAGLAQQDACDGLTQGYHCS